MPTDATLPGRDRTAIAGSIAVHLCALFALAALFHGTFASGEPDERPYLSAIVEIKRLATPRPTPVPPKLAAAPRAASVATAPPIRAAVAVARSPLRQFVAPEVRAAVPVRRAKHARTALAPSAPDRIAVAQPSAPATAAAVAANVAPATPAPSATAAPAPAREDGIGNFGETYPAAVDPQLRSAFFTGIAGSFDIRITVDENGRATAVDFVRAPDDPALREQLRARLLAARFIPAACNGLRCAGTVELRN